MNKRRASEREARPTWTTLALMAAIAAVLAGCGDGNNYPSLGSNYPVKGKVTLADGTAPPPVTVIFSGPVTSRVTTESDGTFAFKGDNPGLPAGDYQIRLEAADPKGSLKKSVSPVPQKYHDEDTSGLTAKVTSEGPNDFELKLSKAGQDAVPGSGRGSRRP
jgi:hypothetical protein